MGRGLFAGTKMAKDRQKFRWSDRRYKKRMLKSRAKHDPLAGSTQAKGIVIEKVGIEAKQPNSGIRKSREDFTNQKRKQTHCLRTG